MLRHYTGHRWREHFSSNSAPHTLTKYGNDRSGSKIYRFNSAGFRGEEYNPLAQQLIVVCGCSLTFGVGLNLEETWCQQFKELYAGAQSSHPDTVNLLNLSHGGCSNDYIARTLLAQTALRPDLVLVQFTYSCRSEGFADGTPFDISPWLADLPVEAHPWVERTQGYYFCYSDEFGFLNTLKNMLLLQLFYKARGTDYLFSWVECRKLNEPRFRANAALSPLIDLIDASRLCEVSVQDLCVDQAADGEHPGPKSHKSFAKQLFAFHQLRMMESRV